MRNLLHSRRDERVAFVLSIVIVVATFALVATQLGQAATPSLRADSLRVSDAPKNAREFARPDSTPFPGDNAYSPQRAALGKMLFFDPRLSAKKSISCASCHNPALSWGDGNARAIGHNMAVLGRRTPTILNSAWSAAQFWDGRAETLEDQALGPVQASGEMNLPLDSLVGRLNALEAYKRLFAEAYPGEVITPKAIAKAIATFERTVVSGVAPFDRWVSGDANAISAEAKSGFALFTGKANCAKCHSSWRFTDDSFHDIGVPGADSGRARIVPIPTMYAAFKTPTLRNVDRRAPYMHDGSEATLDDVVELYNLGGRVHRPSLSADIKPLKLSAAERRALVAFMKTLTSEDAPVTIPVLPR